jgi:uncharacterized membrane protein (DUF2068 family)
MPSRPLGIVLIVLYSALGALLSVLVALLAFGGAAVVGRAAAGWMGLLSLALLAFAVAAAAVAYGLWTRQRWAPQLTIVTYWVSAALGVAGMLMDTSAGNIVLQLVGIAIALVIIRYMRKPEINALFVAP